MSDDEVPPAPPSPPQPPFRPAGHGKVPAVPHVHPAPQPQRRPSATAAAAAAAAMFGEQKEKRPEGPSPAELDARLPRTADGKVANWFVRILVTVMDPPPGHRRTWARAHPQPLQESQERLRKLVQDEEKKTKLRGRKLLAMKGMTPEKRRQIENILMHHQRNDQDPRFEWLPAMIKLQTEKDGKEVFTRAMDIVIKRVPRAVIIQPQQPMQQPMHAQQPQMHPQMHPHAWQQPHGANHGAQYPARANHGPQYPARRQGEGGHGITVIHEGSDLDEHKKKKKDKGGKGEKKKKAEVHNNRPKVYALSSADSESEVDSLFSGSELDTPESSVSGDPHRRRRSSVYKHSRRNSELHGLRDHKHRSPPRERPELRTHNSHNSRRGSTSSYTYEMQMRREEEERRVRDQEIRLARAEGMLEGMHIGDQRRASVTPRLQIDERSQYPIYQRGGGGGGGRYPRGFYNR